MLQEIIDRLKTHASVLDEVRPAEDIEAITKGTAPRSGTVFVLPYRERAQPNQLSTGGFRQLVVVQVLVALVIRRHDDASGGKKAVLFDDAKTAIEAALAGWEPPSGEDALSLVSAQAAPLGNGVTVYVQTWETSRFLEGNS